MTDRKWVLSTYALIPHVKGLMHAAACAHREELLPHCASHAHDGNPWSVGGLGGTHCHHPGPASPGTNAGAHLLLSELHFDCRLRCNLNLVPRQPLLLTLFYLISKYDHEINWTEFGRAGGLEPAEIPEAQRPF